MNRSEAPPGNAGNLSLHFTGTSTTTKELHLQHLHSFLQCLNHEHLSERQRVWHDLHNKGINHLTDCNCGVSMVF